MNINTPESISLLLISDDEDEVYAIAGKLVNGETGPEFIKDDGAKIPLESEWLERARPITDNLREIFDPESNFFIPLTIGPVPEGADPVAYIATGLKLPTEGEEP